MADAALDWLLAPDPANPGVRFFALRDLVQPPPAAAELAQAQAAVMSSGPVPAILAAQNKEGGWAEKTDTYNPKYRATVWSMAFLAQLGADGRDEGVRRAAGYVLDHCRSSYGGFAYNATRGGMIQCLQGNLVRALVDLGLLGDERLDEAVDWLARSVTGAGIAPADDKEAALRYYRSGNSGPGFCCAANEHLPCAWGAVKVVHALAAIPAEQRSQAVKAAIQVGVAFLLSKDPAQADYPWPSYSNKPNGSWFKFGYPIAYVTDVLENLEALVALGYGQDPRLRRAYALVLAKRDRHGRWPLEYTYNGKTWVDVETPKQPSKWVTLRALRVLQPRPAATTMAQPQGAQPCL